MPDDGFKTLLFGQPGPHVSAVVRALKKGVASQLRLAPSWAALDMRLMDGQAQCVIICLNEQMEADEGLIGRLHERLAEARLPALVALAHPVSFDKPMGAALSSFDVVIGTPVEASVLRESIALAIELGPSAGPEPQPSPAAGGTHEAKTREAPAVTGSYPPSVGSQPAPSGPAPSRPEPPVGSVDDGDVLGDSDIEVRSWGPPAETAPDDPSEPERPARARAMGQPGSTTIEIAGQTIDPQAVLEAALRDAEQGVEPGAGGEVDRGASDTGNRVAARRWDADNEPGKGESEAAKRLVDDDEGPPLESRLPPLRRGDLSRVEPARVLLAHEIAGSSGALRFEHGGISREVTLLNGVPGFESVGEIDDKHRARLFGALLWSSGSYTFEGKRVNAARFRSLGSVVEVVHGAIHHGMTVNQASSRLTEHFSSYVAITERTRDQWDVLGKLPGLWDLLTNLSVGPLEQVIAKAGAGFQAALKNLVFCSVMDLVAFSPTPRKGRVAIQYVEMEATPARPVPPATQVRSGSHRSVDAAPRREPSQPASTSAGSARSTRPDAPSRPAPAPQAAPAPEGTPAGEPPDVEGRTPSAAETPVAAEAVAAEGPTQKTRTDEDPSEEVLAELFAIHERWSGKSAYEVFGLSEGCGRQAVSDRYFQMVREHHPDTYGLARSPQVKPLAEMVFMTVQRAYRDLRGLERGNSPSTSSPGSAIGADTTAGEVVSDVSSPGISSFGTPPDDRSTPGTRPGDRSTPGTRAAETSTPGAKPGEPSTPGQRVAASASASGPVDEQHSQAGVTDPTSLKRDLPSESGPEHAPAPEGVDGSGDTPTGPLPTVTDDGGPVVGSSLDSTTRMPAQNPSPTGGIVDSASRLRALASRIASGDHRAAPSSTSPPRPAPIQSRKLPPEQHFRNGVHMIKAQAFERAVEELEAALEGRPASPIYKAHLAWARFRVDLETAEEQKGVLRELVEEDAAEEHASLFLALILTAEGDEHGALVYYQRCLTVNPRNVEALRRVRLHRMRNATRKEGIFDRLFSKKTKKSR